MLFGNIWRTTIKHTYNKYVYEIIIYTVNMKQKVNDSSRGF
ncbi:hypothetical protein [Sebaldella sp. S0638]|nr:hypothetical protein [Sebaldella sp. S0638]